ncbi:MAG: hypothetical protein ACLTYW_00410 [Collinsella sp.]
MPQDRPNSIEAFCDQLLAGWAACARPSQPGADGGELSDDERRRYRAIA